MSDPKSSYGEPVEEPTAVDDVVGSAHEGIADAEAAARNAAAAPNDAVNDEPAATQDAQASHDAAIDESDDSDSSGDLSYIDTTPETVPEAQSEAAGAADDTSFPTVVAPDVVAAATVAPEAVDADAAPTAIAAVAVAGAGAGTAVADSAVAPAAVGYASSPQPIFVQAPESPIPRGNRAAAGAIGLLAALSFAVLYLAAWLGFGLLGGEVTTASIATSALDALATSSLWVPVVVFFLAFWVLGGLINRGRWGAWVIFGLFVGVASYGGHLLGALFQAPFWNLTAREGVALIEGQLLAPLAITAFVIGRELTIWFGAWVAARGAKVTELNAEAQREYERTLEAGPQLTHLP